MVLGNWCDRLDRRGEAGEIGDNVEVSLEYVFSFELEEEIVLLERVNEVC